MAPAISQDSANESANPSSVSRSVGTALLQIAER